MTSQTGCMVLLHQKARGVMLGAVQPFTGHISSCRAPCCPSGSATSPPVYMRRLNALPSRKIDPSQFSTEQLAFLERKRAYKSGEILNPLQAFKCPECGGKGECNQPTCLQVIHQAPGYELDSSPGLTGWFVGTVVCWECSGAGVNHRDIVQDVMG